ncbi:MAG: PEGA domain-containing protein [Acidobacteriaceae bacterium]|nr:PEGA domain-containing protein [Acidobacteriaceae bacterium]
MRTFGKVCWVWVLFALVAAAFAENKVLGELELQGASKVERDSGVWVDGHYLGYLKELKGDKKILLLPGEHEIAVRQDGYQDFETHVTLQPAEKQVLIVTMIKDSRFKMPAVFSEVKLAVNPNRAAVFVDDLFVGHASEFDGVAHSLLVAPGHRKITISLPGYQTFQTEVDLVAKQKFRLKTDLVKAPASVATSASN